MKDVVMVYNKLTKVMYNFKDYLEGNKIYTFDSFHISTSYKEKESVVILYLYHHTNHQDKKYAIALPLKIFNTYIDKYNDKNKLLFMICEYYIGDFYTYSFVRVIHYHKQKFHYDFSNFHQDVGIYHKDLPFLFSNYYSIHNPMLNINGINNFLKDKGYRILHVFDLRDSLKSFAYNFVIHNPEYKQHTLYIDELFYNKHLRPHNYIFELICSCIEDYIDNKKYNEQSYITNMEFFGETIQRIYNKHRVLRCRFCRTENKNVSVCTNCNERLL